MGGIFLGWYIFSITAYGILLFTVPWNKYKYLWPIGLISIIILYLIDSTLIKLGAFSYSFPNPFLSGLPTLYLISGFVGGILLVHFLPSKETLQIPYMLLSPLIFLMLEFLMIYLGYFHYHNWNGLNSYFLNIFGFSIVLWFSSQILLKVLDP